MHSRRLVCVWAPAKQGKTLHFTLSTARARTARALDRLAPLSAPRMDLHSTVQRALAAAGAPPGTPVEPLVAMLRSHVSPSAVSHHIAQHTKSKVQERAVDGERFGALHDELRARGVAELDKFTVFLQRVQDEKAVVEMLRLASATSPAAAGSSAAVPGWRLNAASAAVARSTAPLAGSAEAPAAADAGSGSAAAWEAGWLLSRPYLSGTYLAHGVREGLTGGKEAGGKEAGGRSSAADAPSQALGALPLKEQEELLVSDLLCVLAGVEGSFIRSTHAPPSSLDAESALLPASAASRSARVRFTLPAGGGTSKTTAIDPSLRELAVRVLPLGERYLALSRFAHAKCVNLDAGLVMHAFCAALRACLHEHLVCVARLEQQHKSRALSLHQLWYYLQPASRSLSVLDDIVAAVGNARGGALLRALHDRRRVLSGDVESTELLEYLLDRTATPFLDMLHAWVHEGICRDPYAEFMVVERPTERRDDLVTDFNCQYWQRRFYLAPAQVPAFLEPHAEMILTTGKSLHVVRECGRMPAPRQRASSAAAGGGVEAMEQPPVSRGALVALSRGGVEPPSMAPFTLEERELASRLTAANAWAADLLVSLLMGEHALMARLSSVKHYFLLDQGDFFVHFLDTAEDELTKPVGEISRARLQSKLDIALRQSAVADPFRESLTCGLLPYNLTNQLLRIINASKTSAPAPPPPQSASRTPGLDAFTFEYEVSWPLALVLSKHAITKYQLLFRHLFHCKHVERQLSASWLAQQEAKQLLGASHAFSAAFGLRQRMLHFLFNIQHYMMFEVIEPNWHVLTQKLRSAPSLDTLLAHHADFLDASLRECMLRDAVLLKLLAKLLTICVIFADQTRIVMTDVAAHLASAPLPNAGPTRRERLADLADRVAQTVHECKYHPNVVKLAAKFDEELKRLLDELRRQAHREWNLAHLCSRLDYNAYWSTPGHARHGAAASITAATGVGTPGGRLD